MRPSRSSAAACALAIVIVAIPRAEAEAPPGGCGRTTLDATIADLDGDGILACGPGDPLVVREELADPSSSRAGRRTPLTAFLLLADLQIGDEELTLPSRTNWREHPAMLPHLVNAQLDAANRIIAEGGPILGAQYDMAFALGDLADNAQYNETRLVIDLMDGHHVVDPDSGDDGYDGEKGGDPRGAGDLQSPVRGESILDLANEPFYAHGLRRRDGTPFPWYAVHGNHDSKVMGGIPHDDSRWRKAADRWARGDKKIFELNGRFKTELQRIRDEEPQEEASFWIRTFELVHTNPSLVGDVRTVPPDDHRHILSREEWIAELGRTTGVPKGHGFGSGDERCPDVYPDAHARRACYSFDRGKFRFVVLDDNPLEGYTTGSIDEAQFLWLEWRLIGASTSHFDGRGTRVQNPDADDRYVVVLSHHTSKGMSNSGNLGSGSGELRGKDLEELLLRFPNVIIHANGHSHSNKLWAHTDERKDTRYWEINTASVADNPHNSRSVEIADNGDGTLSIFGVLFEPGVHPNPRKIDWDRDDATDERSLGGTERAVNEDWLAAAGLEQAANDVREYRYGADESRNVELLIPDPIVSSPVAQTSIGDGTQEVAAVVLAAGIVVWFIRRRRRRPPSPPPPAAALPRTWERQAA